MSVGGPSTATVACGAAGEGAVAEPAAVPRASASVCSNACQEGISKVLGRCQEGATKVPGRRQQGTAGRALTHEALGRRWGCAGGGAAFGLGGAGAGRWWSWAVVLGARTSHSTSGGTLPRGTPCSSGDAAIVLASTVTVSTMPKCVKPAESSASSPKRSRKMAHSGSTAPG